MSFEVKKGACTAKVPACKCGASFIKLTEPANIGKAAIVFESASERVENMTSGCSFVAK